MKTVGSLEKLRGFMMVEILIVISIIVVSVLAALAVAQKSIYLSRQSLHQSQAAFLLEEGAEAVRIARDNAWVNVSSLNLSTDYYLSFSGGTWTLSTSPSGIDIFTRKIIFSSAYRDANEDLISSGALDSQTRLATIDVSWLEGGQTFSKTIQFYLADIFS
ncbi:hypothetical protein A3B85_03135 [Candidatus Nomurabacteria bacterium RIFCSPHIGHO2_02_FULL_37_13]|uniref:Type 4 fimbrial biogenesis protein PilX N-terminal domain-containing protein n=1 Tax=Candidatus Nomurabacteria bacterium RIFCSPHIGHO2_02_FULL_37_13 TaxID=1801750 RepID=A0A1F6W728_9BACT|nr:MAG: hypothetical protein A2640_00830 [Candidatus Nomurabacteria bacterium RIFCSPHIGHO2_01_FULL_36_23]OGI77728.1 MAG: hypothetical protein A3B85_03135 [Candidatus Nomurabacteria bacterium RIFCSPHIGHO2_02_FULL_37_13]OGI87847.1 MAG: hypothetical protein A2906_02335 [Candidatus Nomurabacteria bacterium RIFCSPLOWO2_01_FULL_37_25]